MDLKIIPVVVIVLGLSLQAMSASESRLEENNFSSSQPITHFEFNQIHRAVALSERAHAARANYDHLIAHLEEKWHKKSSYVGLDMVNVIIHVRSDVISMEVLTVWYDVQNPHSPTPDESPILRRESYAFIFAFTDITLQRSDDRFLEKIELIITGVISGNIPDDTPEDHDHPAHPLIEGHMRTKI